MFKVERRNHIIDRLKKEGRVIVEDLSKELDVTPTTIRRDLQFLEEKNIAKRTFGGAVLINKLNKETAYKDKSSSNIELKSKIATYASSLIEDGSIIILDAGTTNLEIAKRLNKKKNLTIVTPDVFIGGYLSINTEFNILCTGGFIQNRTGVCLGTTARDLLKNIKADICFVGTSSIGLSYEISTPTMEKAELKRQMMASSNTSILVTDSSKFGQNNFIRVCELDDFDLLITDNDINPNDLENLKKLDINYKLL